MYQSYSQNFEDVLLRRALKDIKDGFYLDVGAADPVEMSDTYGFYQLGWHGINIEPQQAYFDRLTYMRPRDINLQVVVGERRQQIPLYLVSKERPTGLSTLDRRQAEEHQAAGWTVDETIVEMFTLADICRAHVAGSIHFMKIDVEGSERRVLLGADFEIYRPWIVLIEATKPTTEISCHELWEDILFAANYRFAWFDGLNRFYVAAEHYEKLGPKLAKPPNIFDSFFPAHFARNLLDSPAANPTDFSFNEPPIDFRIELASQCCDTIDLPRVHDAGKCRALPSGAIVQVMHNGLLVEAGAYCGDWMTRLISASKGWSEPQLEKVFNELVLRLSPEATMIELGSYWSYYSLWFLKDAPNRRAIAVEPDPKHLEVGRRNAKLNGLAPIFVNAAAAATSHESIPFCGQSSGSIVLPQTTVEQLMQDAAIEILNILHCDIDGAELEVIKSCENLFRNGRIRWLVLSTHAPEISGDPLTHQRCLELIQNLGGVVEAEHDVYESFSGDGMIVARFPPEPCLFGPINISYNRYGHAYFRNPSYGWADAITLRHRTIEAHIGSIFRNVLLREVDGKTLENLTSRLCAGTISLDEVLVGVLKSAEFISSLKRFLTAYDLSDHP